MDTTTPRPFQVGDRVLFTDRIFGDTVSGVIDKITPGRPGSLMHFAYIWRDDDPERTRGRRVITLALDLTAASSPALVSVELWDGPINGAPTGADVYVCPVLGCDYAIAASGPVDPDEPDYHAEDIEAHKRGHQPAADPEWVIGADGEPVDVREVIDDDPAGALTGEPGTVAPDPGLLLPAEARTALADGISVAADRAARGADATPSLVQLDREEAVQAALVALGEAALTWYAADPDQPAGIEAEAVLSAATAALYRAVTR